MRDNDDPRIRHREDHGALSGADDGRVRVTDALTVRGAAVGVAVTAVVGVAVTVATEVGAV